MRDALNDLTIAAEARAAELRALAQFADDRGSPIVEAEAATWERLARNGREALYSTPAS
jgi:hypothetical protein